MVIFYYYFITFNRVVFEKTQRESIILIKNRSLENPILRSYYSIFIQAFQPLNHYICLTKYYNMKKLLVLSSAIILCLSAFKSSDGDRIPSATIKKLDGSSVNSNTFINNGKPMIISFWATWCKPCKKELDAINEEYAELQKETGVKLIAISIDDARSSGKVVTDVKVKGWTYEVYIDENQDFKRAMNVNNVPHTFLVDGDGKIVWSHNSYAEGDEEKLFENVRKLAKGEKLAH
jgi:cytochrome c biogenesis protein CcmG/thiol:disulfide interchange protein DsbE